MADRPIERDLFSVKAKKLSAVDKEKELKRKKTKGDNAQPNGKKRKIDVYTNDEEEHIEILPLSYKHVPVGQVVLGSILKIFTSGMVVSLPNRMQGHLPILNISQPYNDLFNKISNRDELGETSVYNLEELYSVGHLIITKIQSVVPYENGTSKIILSILPEDVNKDLTSSDLYENSIVQSAVVSEEENGYLMDTGIRNIRAAFLSKENAPKGTVGVGSVFLCAVKKIFNNDNEAESLNISLSAESSFMNTPFPITKKVNVRSIVPGAIVSAKVKKITSEGLEIAIDAFQGFVSSKHLMTLSTKKKNYKLGRSVLARVLYINELTSVIYCSLNSKICGLSAFEKKLNKISIGDVCDATILMKSTTEVHFSLPNNCYGVYSVIKINPSKKSMKKLKIGSFVTCRIKHIHLLDQIYIVSVENKEGLERKNLFVGKIVSVKIGELEQHGASGVITGGSVAFIPKMHFPESNSEESCSVGRKYDARILQYTPDKDIQLTLKSDLVNCGLPLVTEFSPNVVGLTTMGCIVGIFRFRILVQFFGGTKAMIPKSQIPEHEQKNLHIGSVVKCRISSFDETERQLKASMLLDPTNAKKIDVGQLYKNESKSDLMVKQCKVYLIENDTIHVHINKFQANAFIPLCHLSDDNELSERLFSLISIGDEIRNAIMFSQNDLGCVLSLKPSIYSHFKNCTENQDEIKCGSICPSVISKAFDNNIIVMTSGRESEHYLERNFIFEEKFSSVLHVGFENGQTLMLKCVRAEENRPVKFVSYLKAVMPNPRTSGLQVLYNTLSTEYQVKKSLLERSDINFGKIEIGSSYIGKVLYICEAGALIRIPDLNLDGVLQPQNYPSSGAPKLNKSIQVRILNVNYKEKCLEVIAKQEINKFFNVKDHGIGSEQESSCEILLAKKDFIIGRLNSLHEGQVVYLPSKRHVNDLKGRHSFYEIGKTYDIVIEYVNNDFILANLKAHTNVDLLDLEEEHPSFDFKGSNFSSAFESLILNENALTKNDFKNKAKEKIERVTKFTKTHSDELSKWDTLQDDNFSQVDDILYKEFINLQREERKKLKKKKGPIKVQKAIVGKGNNILTANTEVYNNVEPNNKTKKEKLNAQEQENNKQKAVKRLETPKEGDSERPAKRLKKERKVKEEESKEKIEESSSSIDANKFLNNKTKKEKLNAQEQKNSKQKAVKRLETPKEGDSERPAKRLKKERKVKDEESKAKIEESSSSIDANKFLNNKTKKEKLNAQEQKNNKQKAVKRLETPKEGDSERPVKSLKKNRKVKEEESKFLEVPSSGFDWSGQICSQANGEEDSSSDEDDDVETDKKEQKSVSRLNKFEKSAKSKTAEEKTRELELERLDQDREPETALEYEEKVNRNPHSADIWIEYISFHLQNAETEKARALARRSLAEIPHKMTEERLKLWNVILRLEMMFGTVQTLQKAMAEAILLNDDLKIYNMMIEIYINANKVPESLELIKKMVKKHSLRKEVWMQGFTYTFRVNELTEARALLDKSLLSLNKKDQLEAINRFAQLELKNGDLERGKTIFEKMLSNFPKRLDIWNVYADLLLKRKDIVGARDVLERITGLKLKMKQVRSAFKKLLEFEKEYGTPVSVEKVKKRVEDYVTAALKDDE